MGNGACEMAQQQVSELRVRVISCPVPCRNRPDNEIDFVTDLHHHCHCPLSIQYSLAVHFDSRVTSSLTLD